MEYLLHGYRRRGLRLEAGDAAVAAERRRGHRVKHGETTGVLHEAWTGHWKPGGFSLQEYPFRARL